MTSQYVLFHAEAREKILRGATARRVVIGQMRAGKGKYGLDAATATRLSQRIKIPQNAMNS